MSSHNARTKSTFSFPSLAGPVDRRRLLQATSAGALAAGFARFGLSPASLVSAQENAINAVFGPGGPEAGEGATVQVGMNLAMTGQGAFFGRVMSRGAQLAAAQIGESGGPDIQVSINDHESGEVPPSVNGVRRLITQNSISVLQTSYGAPSEALIPIIQQNNVLTFNGGGSSPRQLFQDYLWMTRMLFAYDPTPGALQWISENYPDARRLAVIGTLENGVEAMEQLVPEYWPEFVEGGEITITEIHDVGLTDFSEVIARVRASNPDAIFTVSFGNDLGYMVQQFREANVELPIVGIEFTQDAQTIAGEHYDTFVFATDYYDPTNPNPWNQAFVEAYLAEYDEEPEYYGANYYEQVFVVWDLVRRVVANGGDPNSGEALQEALIQEPVFASVYGGDAENVGQMSFDTEAHTINKPMGVFAVEDGVPVLLQPISPELVPPKLPE
jgi:branched-chain amino acid transport system substrate-binding protein